MQYYKAHKGFTESPHCALSARIAALDCPGPRRISRFRFFRFAKSLNQWRRLIGLAPSPKMPIRFRRPSGLRLLRSFLR